MNCYLYQLLTVQICFKVLSHYSGMMVWIEGCSLHIKLPNNFDEADSIVRELKLTTPLGGEVIFLNYEQQAVQHAIRNHIPLSEITENRWCRSMAFPAWERWPSEWPDELIFIPHLKREDITLCAIDSVRLAGRIKHVVVLDQSGQPSHARWPDDIIIGKCGVGRTFTQIQNWFQRQAELLGLKRFYFMHSDATVSPNTFDKLDATSGDIVFTWYDSLVRFNVPMLRDIGCWDESFEWYVSDVDFYNRIRWSGRWTITGCLEHGVWHHGSMTKRNMSPDEFSHTDHAHDWAIKHYQHKWGHNFRVMDSVPYRTPYNA